jgi:acyl dehydratase
LTTTVQSPAELTNMAPGTHFGYSQWLQIDQDRIDTFADATDDHQWIHVDPGRAKDGPFGSTIAHGYLTLSLLIPLWTQILELNGLKMAVNYGLNKVRFPAPVPVGGKIRAGATLVSVEEIAGNGVQAVVDFVIERDGSEKPCCVAQAVLRYYG